MKPIVHHRAHKTAPLSLVSGVWLQSTLYHTLFRDTFWYWRYMCAIVFQVISSLQVSQTKILFACLIPPCVVHLILLDLITNYEPRAVWSCDGGNDIDISILDEDGGDTIPRNAGTHPEEYMSSQQSGSQFIWSSSYAVAKITIRTVKMLREQVDSVSSNWRKIRQLSVLVV